MLSCLRQRKVEIRLATDINIEKKANATNKIAVAHGYISYYALPELILPAAVHPAGTNVSVGKNKKQKKRRRPSANFTRRTVLFLSCERY